jgi:hypothetical protein
MGRGHVHWPDHISNLCDENGKIGVVPAETSQYAKPCRHAILLEEQQERVRHNNANKNLLVPKKRYSPRTCLNCLQTGILFIKSA